MAIGGIDNAFETTNQGELGLFVSFYPLVATTSDTSIDD